MECAEDKLVCDGQIKEQNRDRRETNSSEWKEPKRCLISVGSCNDGGRIIKNKYRN
jgi:Ni,Fe-hydrogenase III small subunit